MLIRKLKVNFLSVLLFGSFIGLSFSCNNDLSLNMPQFRTNEIKKGDRILIDMTGSISKSALRSIDGSSGQFDIDYQSADGSDAFIVYNDMHNIPCVVAFRNRSTGEKFFAEGVAKIEVRRNDNNNPRRNDDATLKLSVNTESSYNISSDWEVKPIVGFKKKIESPHIFSPEIEYKMTNRKTDNLSIPLTSAWIPLNATNVNNGQHVSFKDVSFYPDGMLFNISVHSQFADPVCIKKITNTKNSKIAFHSCYDMSNEAKPTNGSSSIYIADNLDERGNHMFGVVQDYMHYLDQIFVWANIFEEGSENLSCFFTFDPISRDPFKDKSKKYSKEFFSPYMSLNWTPQQTTNITKGKVYSLKMVAKSMDYPMITEVYINGPYSMVEIYNPTSKPIPLNDLFIVKTKSNGDLKVVDGWDIYNIEGYPYARQGTLGLPLYIGPNHNNSTYNIYERKSSSSDLVIFGDDDTNIISNPNALIQSSNVQTLEAGKIMVLAGPGYLRSDGSFNQDAYNRYAPKDDLTQTKSNIQIFVVADNSGYSSQAQATTSTKDIEATLNISNYEGLAIIQKKNNNNVIVRTADKYLVVDVFPFDNGRSTKAIPFYMCRYDGIVYPFTRSASLEDTEIDGHIREGLNSQWYLNEINGTEQIHSIGTRYRNW